MAFVYHLLFGTLLDSLYKVSLTNRKIIVVTSEE